MSLQSQRRLEDREMHTGITFDIEGRDNTCQERSHHLVK